MSVETQPKLLYGLELDLSNVDASLIEDKYELIARNFGCYLETHGNAWTGDKTWVLTPIKVITQRNFPRSKLKIPKGSHSRLQQVCERLKLPYGKPQWHLVVDTF